MKSDGKVVNASFGQSPPSRGAWIEIVESGLYASGDWSPPSRGAWIEIPEPLPDGKALYVAPLAGGVD